MDVQQQQCLAAQLNSDGLVETANVRAKATATIQSCTGNHCSVYSSVHFHSALTFIVGWLPASTSRVWKIPKLHHRFGTCPILEWSLQKMGRLINEKCCSSNMWEHGQGSLFLSKLEYALCGDANPCWLERQSFSGWHHTMDQRLYEVSQIPFHVFIW